MTCHITAEDLMHAGLTKSNSGAQIFDFPKFSHRLSITILRTVGATVNNARAFTLSGCTVHVNHCKCSLDRFTKTFFWNFQSIQADLCYILIYKQMLEKTFCSNIAPSLSSGNHLFYKAEYMGQSCLNQV